MTFTQDKTAGAVFFVVTACWLGLGLILVLGKRGAAKTETKRDLKSHLGFAIEMIAFAICFVFPHRYFSPPIPLSKTTEIILAVLTIAMAVGSLWLCFAAARTLGKQWSLVARVVEGHQLIREGPYAVVRNPIYLAMFGLLIAVGLAVSHWQVLAISIVVYLAGTQIRIHSEERLLRDAFGAEFERYAARVPALFPRIV